MLRALRLFIFSLIALFAILPQTILASESKERCGTVNVLNYIQQRTNIAAKKAQSSCPAEAYYDSVFTRTTTHFEIFYTKDGPHATTEAFVDSLSKAMEAAYVLFTGVQKTLPPKGTSKTYHYQKDVTAGLYPIEVLELSLARNITAISQSSCSACFALALPDYNDTRNSTILIDNDFSHPEKFSPQEFYKKDSSECAYRKSTNELRNETYGYSYTKEFGKAIRITALHELFHSVQFRYYDANKYNFFWIESQGAAMEEIGAPDVDDYLSTTQSFFKMKWHSLEQLSESSAYALAPFFISMQSLLGNTFNSKLLETISKDPEKNFNEHFSITATTLKQDPSKVFHDFAKRAFLSGSRFQESQKLSDDQSKWRNMQIPEGEIDTNAMPYFTYRSTAEYPGNLPGKVSYILKNDSSYTFLDINSYREYKKNYAQIFAADSSILVYSNLQGNAAADSTSKQSKFIAYPNPWKGATPLCFSGLPDKDIIEIRTRSGSLVNSWNYSSSEFCIAANEVHKLFAPGLYYYRAGRSGKMDKLILLK